MPIQADLTIERQGDLRKLAGMVDMGETNNISVICNKEKRFSLQLMPYNMFPMDLQVSG